MTYEEPLSRQILLLEDDECLARDMQEILADPRKGCYDVTVAENVESGIKKARELVNNLYAAILDHNLPDGKGTAVYLELQNLSSSFAANRVAVWSSYPPGAKDDYKKLQLQSPPPTLEKSCEEVVRWLNSLEEEVSDKK